MKRFLKALGMAAAGGAIGGAIQMAHGYTDPQAVQLTRDMGHQFLVAALSGAIGGIIGLFREKPE